MISVVVKGDSSPVVYICLYLLCVLNCYLRFWRRRGDPGALHSAVICPSSANIAVERVHTSGHMLGYHEVHVYINTCTWLLP
jgi:hypothetical protein